MYINTIYQNRCGSNLLLIWPAIYRLELEPVASVQYGHTISHSIAHGVLADGEFINEHDFKESQAMHDREFAVDCEYLKHLSHTNTPETVIHAKRVRRLTMLYVSNALPLNGGLSSS